MKEEKRFYVYKHIRLDNNSCFYIGKGTGKRSNVRKRNDHHDRIIKNIDYKIVIVKDNLTEKEALDLEKELIRHYVFDLGYGIDIKGYRKKKSQFKLSNQTWGGDGISRPMPQEVKDKISLSHLNLNFKHSEESKKKMSISSLGIEPWNKGKKNIYSEETLEKMRNARLNRDPWNKGKKCEQLSGSKNPSAKAVVCITTNEIFTTMKEASEKYGVSVNSICGCCKGRNKTGGKLSDGTKLVWKYYNKDNTEITI